MLQIRTVSLHSTVEESLRDVLLRSGFSHAHSLAKPLLSLVGAIGAYTEEGRRLYPEVVLTTNTDALLSQVPFHRRQKIGVSSVHDAVPRALKQCAPLASGGWVIYLQSADDETMEFGVASVAVTDLSPDFHTQTVGDLAIGDPGLPPTVFFRPVHSGEVEIASLHDRVLVVLGLGTTPKIDATLESLARSITLAVPDDRRPIARDFTRRLLRESVRDTHGCLLSVVDTAAESIRALRSALPDGVYLETPIDLVELLRDLDEARSRESALNLRSYMSLVRGMVAQDGITVFTADARLVCYNLFVPQSTIGAVVGGARQRAFRALCDTGCVLCAVAVSHDGSVTLWESPGPAQHGEL